MSQIREAAALACVKGVKERKVVVGAREEEMLLEEDGLMIYRLGGISLPSPFFV
jgi:hypothetical protein